MYSSRGVLSPIISATKRLTQWLANDDDGNANEDEAHKKGSLLF